MLGDVTGYSTGAASFAHIAFAVTATWAIAFLADLRIVPVIHDAPRGPAWLAINHPDFVHLRHGGRGANPTARRPSRGCTSAHTVPRSETKAGLS
jgi:hypothetical protein